MNVDGGIRQFRAERYLSDGHRNAVARGLHRYWQSQPLCAGCGKVRVRRWGRGYCYRCKVKRERAER